MDSGRVGEVEWAYVAVAANGWGERNWCRVPSSGLTGPEEKGRWLRIGEAEGVQRRCRLGLCERERSRERKGGSRSALAS
ncbi:hypothetical protein KFK09_015021 [Dendrobium nobile]|uniref:Uncharacterized protein n=1 Tax=Dendrobium nobile TaxID=94219 RepID=A0A8T3B3N6_DENNO|nr:hypothetical protein KFK09_015021 [Dendrobium nobile]